MSRFDNAIQVDPIDESTTDGTYFKRRLVKGGVWVPCRLWYTTTPQDGVIYHAEMNGQAVDPFDPPGWPWVRSNANQFKYLTDIIAWAKLRSPNDPYANPHLPVSAGQIPLSPTRKK